MPRQQLASCPAIRPALDNIDIDPGGPRLSYFAKEQAGGEMSEIHGMRLLSQDTLLEHGGVGEGMSLQKTRDGRRIMWLAHEGPPINFTGVDVTDPSRPKVIVQTRLPNQKVRSNSLEACGDILAVAYQVLEPGLTPAGFELFDISNPEEPKSISFVDCSGPYSRGVHQLWFVDGETVHCSSGAPDFQPRNQLDDQIYRAFNVKNPSKPVELGRWWMPGVSVTDAARSTPAFARTTRMSIRTGPIAPTSATSTAAPSCSTSPTFRARRL
jgi:hypothetical protein